MSDPFELTNNPNGVVAKGDIKTVARFIVNIEKKHGEITPELLVKEGRVVGSPIYKYFTNDVNEAAAKRWIDEARMIIRSVYVYIVRPDREPVPVRKWVRVTPTESRPQAKGYVDIIDVFTDDYLRQQLIDRAVQDIQIWKDRYEALKDFSVDVQKIFAALSKIQGKRSKKKKKKK